MPLASEVSLYDPTTWGPPVALVPAILSVTSRPMSSLDWPAAIESHRQLGSTLVDEPPRPFRESDVNRQGAKEELVRAT